MNPLLLGAVAGRGSGGVLHFDSCTGADGTDAVDHVAEIRQGLYFYFQNTTGSFQLLADKLNHPTATGNASVGFPVGVGNMDVKVETLLRHSGPSDRLTPFVVINLATVDGLNNHIAARMLTDLGGITSIAIETRVGGVVNVRSPLVIPGLDSFNGQTGTVRLCRDASDKITAEWTANGNTYSTSYTTTDLKTETNAGVRVTGIGTPGDIYFDDITATPLQ